MQTLDRTPPLTSEVPRHHRRKGPKPFRIEGRLVAIPTHHSTLGSLFRKMSQWHVVGAYETVRARQDAFRTMTSKGDSFGWRWEYRLASCAD